jgi:ribokinase
VSGSPDIVVVGSLNRDYVCRVDRLPGPGETRLGSELALFCGGKGGNQAVAAALTGAGRGVGVALVGAVGADPDGETLRAGLADAGVDVADVAVRRDVRSGAALITVADDGENAIVVAPGANATVTTDDVAAALRRRAPGLVLAQGELPAAVVTRAVTTARDLGARPVVNLAPAFELDDAVLAVCDPLVVNRGEAAAVLGIDPSSGGEPESLARRLGTRARSVVVTAGAAGAWTARDGVVAHVPARPAEAVDTTGAGDAFTAALCLRLARGDALRDAARYAARAGAAAVRRRGAQSSFPSPAELPAP